MCCEYLVLGFHIQYNIRILTLDIIKRVQERRHSVLTALYQKMEGNC